VHEAPIANNSQPGDVIYDPFVGSGTTIIAAEMMGRRCYAIEIDPKYVDCSIERWQKFTGEKAMLDSRTFAEVKAVRHRLSGDVSGSMDLADEAMRDRKAAGAPDRGAAMVE
jgi:DNA modification methylase